MLSLIIHWFIASLILIAVALLLPGIEIAGLGTALIATLIMGLVNVSIRPLLSLITTPINVLTLGLFTFVVNAGMFALAAWLVPGFEVSNFWAALFGSLLMAVCASLFLNVGGGASRPSLRH